MEHSLWYEVKQLEAKSRRLEEKVAELLKENQELRERLSESVSQEEKVTELLKENQELREHLGEDVSQEEKVSEEAYLPFEELFDGKHFFFVDDLGNPLPKEHYFSRYITKCRRILRNFEYGSLKEFHGMTFGYFLTRRTCGVKTACFLYVICEHYGVKIIPKMKDEYCHVEASQLDERQIKEVPKEYYEFMDELKKSLRFSDEN